MFKVKTFQDLTNPDAKAFSVFAWMRERGFVPKRPKDIIEHNEELKNQVKGLRAEVEELSSQLQKYGAREISLYMENQRHEETREILTLLSEKEGFKYTHIAAEQRIAMLEKQLASLQRHCNSGWESYRALEKSWMKFIYEYMDGGAYPQPSVEGEDNGSSEKN